MSKPFYFMLLRTASVFDGKLFGELAETGLTEGQLKVIDYIGKHQGCEQKSIAKGCRIAPSTVTILLGRMEEDGLIERRSLGNNRRSTHVFLSGAGENAYGKLSEAYASLEDAAFSGFADSEKRDFVAAFERIYGNLVSK